MLALRPLGDCVLVDPDPAPAYHEYKQYQHIVVPEKFSHGPEDRPVTGKITALGTAIKQSLTVGQRVIFGKWAGARIKPDGQKEIILVREEELLAVLE